MDGEFVDTSAWVALFDASDSNHEVAVTYWMELQQTKVPLYTTDYIFDESITLARRRAGYDSAVRLGIALLTSQILNLTRVGFVRRP
ncbi:MAG: PIN domain-containing protein [Abditibacteriales bacterium]|nr:PIN domain-containing protein [Abditibacteriales bacterium]MDW8365807.1 PIN domain-containing protein [Abditibacteriales bacterium]